jgi:hypothetical protein
MNRIGQIWQLYNTCIIVIVDNFIFEHDAYTLSNDKRALFWRALVVYDTQDQLIGLILNFREEFFNHSPFYRQCIGW